jgi:hypothetical protein
MQIPDKTNEIEVSEEKSLICINESGITDKIVIHDDIKGLIWIADGIHKNYVEKENKETYRMGSILVTIAMHHEEPSLIYTKEKIVIPNNYLLVERPPYWPTYINLSPEQKGVYMKLLSNPYDSKINIGFVFLLYYGLERHLLYGNFEEALKVIIKLRDVHKNKSFQAYSANSIVLTCLLRQRGDLVLDFIKSLDKDYEFLFSDNLFLMCYYSFKIPLSAKDLTRMAKTFGFENMNYIKKVPELFIESLKEVIMKDINVDSIDLVKYYSDEFIKNIKMQNVTMFANLSIIDKIVPIPNMISNTKFRNAMRKYLEDAHELVKVKKKNRG